MTDRQRRILFLRVLILFVGTAALLGITWPPRGQCGQENGAQMVFVRNSNIWVANTDGTGERQVTFSNQDKAPALSPDGRLIAFTSGREADPMIGYGTIYTVPSSGGQEKALRITGITAAEDPAFSADGKRIAFIGLSNPLTKGTGDSAVVYADMSVMVMYKDVHLPRTLLRTRRTLLDAGYVYANPSFSPEGRLLAFQHSGSDVSGGFEVVDFKGKKVFSFPKDGSSSVPYWRPRFFPDGVRILCYSPATSEKGKDIIYVVDAKTGSRNGITEGAKPAFVEKGTAIVFERWENKWTENARPDLWYLKLQAGAKARKIISNASEPSGPP